MTQADRLQAVAAGATTGLLGGLLGVGGGMVLIPLLTERFGFTQHQAHGTSLAVIGATALASLVVYGAASHVDWAVALPVALASAVTAPLGARLASRISPLGLRRGFAVLLALVGMRMLWQPWAPGPSLFGHGLAALPFDLVLGAAVGLLAGFMGVGGGSLAVPAMTLLLGLMILLGIIWFD